MSKFNYMHLLGIGKKANVSRAEEEEDEKDAEEEEEESEEDDDKSSKKGKKAKKAEDDDPDAEDDDPDAEDDDPDAEDDEDDPDAEEEEDENKDVKKGRKAERQRCAAIFSSKHAAGRPDLAATLAFTTRLTAKEAIRVMRANGRTVTGAAAQLSQPGRQTLQERMAREPQMRIGVNGGKSGNSTAEKMMSLYNRATGSDKK